MGDSSYNMTRDYQVEARMIENCNFLEGREDAAIMNYIEAELSRVASSTRMTVKRRPVFYSRTLPGENLGPDDLEWVLTRPTDTDSVIGSDYVVRFRPDLEAFEITHSNSDAGPLRVGCRAKPEIGTILPLSAVLGRPFEALSNADRQWLSTAAVVPENDSVYPSRLRYPASLSIFVCGVMQLCPMNRWGLS